MVLYYGYKQPLIKDFPMQNNVLHTLKTYWMYFYDNMAMRYIGFQGRASEKEYTGFFLYALMFVFILTIAAFLFFALYTQQVQKSLSDIEASAHIFKALICLIVYQSLVLGAFILPALSITARRLHDLGKSASALYNLLIPVYGIFWALHFALFESTKPGDSRTNLFGFPPED